MTGGLTVPNETLDQLAFCQGMGRCRKTRLTGLFIVSDFGDGTWQGVPESPTRGKWRNLVRRREDIYASTRGARTLLRILFA